MCSNQENSKIEKSGMPLVSVPVITYNSAKTVIETLESIKAQTYPNIELIISDDCSTDGTVEVCNSWLLQNKDRFKRVEIVTVTHNTGVAANYNRAEDACRGEWVKGIAGDDVFTPNCIQICIDYVNRHIETISLFGRQKTFGTDEDYCKHIDDVFDYSFFNLSPDEQLHYLIYRANCVPTTTYFYNLKQVRKLGIRADERLSLLEDWPRWINLLRAGVKFHFIDEVLVMYRIGGLTTDRKWQSIRSFESGRKFCFLYQYPEWVKDDPEKAVERVVRDEAENYLYLLDSDRQLKQIQQSKAYRLGKAILKLFKWFKK